MNECAKVVFNQFQDLVLAFGHSDEMSFVLHKSTTLFNRRASKLQSLFVSLFAASYVQLWPQFFNDFPLKYLPSFDSRTILYPNDRVLRDYLSWRQVDCHINNLYNTCFWTLVLIGNQTEQQAEQTLKGTLSDAKNELLFTRFNINYNNEPQIFKKGSIVFKDFITKTVTNSATGQLVEVKRKIVSVIHEDLINDEFWNRRAWILSE
eukprot:TRINITY_DN498_c2_g1_i1.p1 TRINITY_DN498_c2_g1~~TRINITY_DN498_c2_g1_i1.p1  ORF type:complete len:207 (-),score=66.44 TRINITY_DN498_c2_g1_i1:235-855(-)